MKEEEMYENIVASVSELNGKLEELGIKYKFTVNEIMSDLFQMTNFFNLIISFWEKQQKSFNLRDFPQFLEATANYYFIVLAIIKGEKS